MSVITVGIDAIDGEVGADTDRIDNDKTTPVAIVQSSETIVDDGITFC